ncbi:MAG: mechanosensitive ion channel domain-containing protein [Candidatus Babeliaceae bacterium]|jgi:potassium efflux system protein
MNNIFRIFIKTFLGILLMPPILIAGPFDNFIKTDKPNESHQNSYTSGYEKQLQILEKEKVDQAAHDQIKGNIEKISAEIAAVKEKMKNVSGRELDLLNKKFSDISQSYQLLTETEHLQQQLIALTEQHIKLLQEYKADPDFKNFKTPVKTTTTYTDFQQVSGKIFDHKLRLTELEKNKKSTAYDLNKRKKAASSAQDDYREKKKQQEDFNLINKKTETKGEKFSFKEQGELLDEQVKLSLIRKELADWKVKEAEAKLSLLDSQIMIIKGQTSALKDDYTRIKRSLNVDARFVKKIEDTLDEKRQLFVDKNDQINDKLRVLATLRDELKTSIASLMQQYNLSSIDFTTLTEWNKEPKSTNDWIVLCTIGSTSTKQVLINTEREYLEAQLELEKAKFHHEEIERDIIKSWHKMLNNKFRTDTEEEVDQEIKRYELKRLEVQTDLTALIDRRAAVINLLSELNSSLDKVKALANKLREQKNLLFLDNSNDYLNGVRLLNKSEENIRKRIDITAKSIEVYSSTISFLTDINKKIEEITEELSSKGFWRRSMQSIEWGELQNFIPDLRQFWKDIYATIVASFSTLSLKMILSSLFAYFSSFGILTLLLLVASFLGIKIFLPKIRDYVALYSAQRIRTSSIITFLSIVMSFTGDYINILYCWVALFFLLVNKSFSQPFVISIFYLLSIPYLIYIAWKFINYLLTINAQRNYQLISQAYQRRFLWVIAPLVYATIFIFLLRQAFLMGGYNSSYVPVILLALNFILLQIALISLISKEQLLSIIPTDTPLWEWIIEHVNKYYYVLLLGIIAIIIMSNPYVGYGRQVLYVLSRMLITILVIPLFSWLHNRIKKTSSDLFFYYSDGETIKERFSSGRTWYGLFVIATFFIFALVGIIICSGIWGYSVTWLDITHWLELRLYSPGIDEATGKAIEVTALSLGKIFVFVIGGIGVTYIVNHFVLQRIFDPLLIGSGVQNTILTLTRYGIILFALLMGLQSAGLDAMTTKLVVLIGILSYYIKEPVADFCAYFIILVQRPIKIGDLITIENEVVGVVRQITPRSTVVRRKNSVMLIIPNSHIITKTVINWNYTRTFFAFEDILFTIPYYHDPIIVKQLMSKVLDENINILKNPAPIIWLNGFVDNGYQFLVRGFLTADKVLEQWEISSHIRFEIVKKLKSVNIELASPTLIKINPHDINIQKALDN